MKRENLNPEDLKVYDAKLKVLTERLEKENERIFYFDDAFEREEISKNISEIVSEIIELKKAFAIDCDQKKDVYSIKHGRIVRNKYYF